MKIAKKKYAEITFCLTAPLTVGSGRNDYTDNDILRDSLGRPYIPASSLAGVYESLLPPDIVKKYLGNTGEKGKYENSQVLIYDAKIVEDEPKYHTARRDMVALDEYKTAIKGAKFDMETLEPGVSMKTYLEQNYWQNDEDVIDEILKLWKNGSLFFGAKTMRGYGAVKLMQIQTAEFCMNKEDEIEEWLKFDMLKNSTHWTKQNINVTTPSLCLTLDLKQAGGISIRRYTTDAASNGKESVPVPDFEQLYYSRKNENGKVVLVPVIPGTSWAGAFRAQVEQLQPTPFSFECGSKEKCEHGCQWDLLFGIVKNGKGNRSIIRFSETELNGAKEKVMTRNAINRFTGGTIDKALFTERTFYGGSGQLKISFTQKPDAAYVPALAAAVADLHYGFLAVGGLTAIGRGLFKVTGVNGKEVGEEGIFELTKEALYNLTKEEEAEVTQ